MTGGGRDEARGTGGGRDEARGTGGGHDEARDTDGAGRPAPRNLHRGVQGAAGGREVQGAAGDDVAVRRQRRGG